MDFAATVAGSTDSAAPRRGAYVVGRGWVLLWGDLAARVPRVRGWRAWEHMCFPDGRGGVWGLSRAVWRAGAEGDGRVGKGWRAAMGGGGCEGAPHLNLLPGEKR